MRRVRKVLDRASEGKKFAPLIDIHTGNEGSRSPSAVTYLSHFPYADSASESSCCSFFFPTENLLENTD